MAGLVPAIHVFGAVGKTWMAATSAAMTVRGCGHDDASDYVGVLQSSSQASDPTAPDAVTLLISAGE
jgi:hypothetical protein